MFKKLIPILIIAILGILDFALIGFAWQNPTQAPPGGNLTLPWVRSGTNVYLTNTSDNVGIGTTDPTIKLAIGDSDTGIQLISDGNLGIYTNNAERIRINSSGNVGIGTTSPGAKLEVAGQIKITGGDPGANKVLTSDASGLASWQTVASGLPSGTSGQTLRYNGSSWVANSVIYNNGTNVGIGTTAPTSKLHLFASENENSAASNFLTLQNSFEASVDYTPPYPETSVDFQMKRRDTQEYVTSGTISVYAVEDFGNNLKADTDMKFCSMGNNNLGCPLYIYGGIRVGIGTAAPTEKLEVIGNVKATAFLTSSDRSLKTNIKPFDKSLQKILNLEPVYFDYKENNQHSLGFIAQDVEKQFPELVTTDSLTGLKSLDYSRLTAPLVMAFKEQQEQINALTQIVESQQQQINELKME
jgi:hypothetical protein